MKLRKNGWGTIEMLLLSGGLLISLLVAVFFISKLYNSFDKSLITDQYNNLEQKLENAAINYIETNEIEISGSYTLTLKTLKDNNLIDDFKDSNGNDCYGYVLITSSEYKNNYSAYILCNEYQTSGY